MSRPQDAVATNARHARTERQALADALRAAGPDAPTLCEGWDATDLAAHVWQRENRPWQAAGLMVKPLAPLTEKAMDRVKRRPFGQLVDDIANGPVSPASPMRVARVDELANLAEYFIHTEDVRRGAGDTTPRALPAAEGDELWREVRGMARAKFARCPVGVALERTGDRPVVVRKGTPRVTLVGPVGELLLFTSGRRDAAHVDVQGAPDVVARFREFQTRL